MYKLWSAHGRVPLICTSRCFPHIINLAFHAVLEAITKIQFADESAEDFVPNGKDPPPATFEEAMKQDPVAMICSLIQGISLICHLLVYGTKLV